MNLYNQFPSIYWSTACLVVNSGDVGDATDYAKIAVAIGGLAQGGVQVELPHINLSDVNFTPHKESGKIFYGLKPISGIGDSFVEQIIANRPYKSMEDLVDRLSPTKAQMLALIKSGSFDELEGRDRKEILKDYAQMQAPNRKTITIASIPTLVENGVYPIEEYRDEYSIYEFNRYLKSACSSTGGYSLDERAEKFFVDKFDSIFLEIDEDGKPFVSTKTWNKIYKDSLDPVREWIKGNKEDIFTKLKVGEAEALFKEYGGLESISKWEMEALSYYHEEHELKNIDAERYGIDDFSTLGTTPEIKTYGYRPKYKTYSIIGTVLGKNKTKGTLDLLTPDGSVVLVKMYKGAFSYYDKQVSEYKPDGTKRIVEKSWFKRGNKLFLHGFRRDGQFLPKSYKDSPYPEVALIRELDDSTKEISLKVERG